MQSERTMADLYDTAPLRTYKLRRYSRRGLMAEGAEVRASSDDEAIAKARALFAEPEYRFDRFEIEEVQ
jgi:hypothetical protein